MIGTTRDSALLTAPDGSGAILEVGDRLDDGWKVERIGQREIVFARDGLERKLAF